MSFLGRPNYPSNRGEVLILLVCAAASITLMSLPPTTRDVVADWLQDFLFAPANEFDQFLQDVNNVNDENMELKKRVLELELQADAARRMVEDAGRLAGPAINPGYAGDLIPCRVVQRRRAVYATSIKIESLVPVDWQPWQPVVSVSGYMGRLRTILNDREAWVELMTAPDFALGVEIEETGLLGILRPRGDEFILEMVGLQERVEVGQTVITSGIAESEDSSDAEAAQVITQRGYPVGTIVEVTDPDNAVVKEIIVEPAANFHFNETVFVVIPLGHGDGRGQGGQW